MHGDEAYLKEDWKWETLHNKEIGISHNNNNIHQILSLQATPGEGIKIGCQVINGSNYGKPTEIRTAHCQ